MVRYPTGPLTKLYVPMKLLAIPGTAALLYGIYNILKERQANAEKAGYGSYYDWFFDLCDLYGGRHRIDVLAVPAGGDQDPGLSHLLPASDRGVLLFFYAPYTKMAHMVYRTVAMLWARMSGRGF